MSQLLAVTFADRWQNVVEETLDRVVPAAAVAFVPEDVSARRAFQSGLSYHQFARRVDIPAAENRVVVAPGVLVAGVVVAATGLVHVVVAVVAHTDYVLAYSCMVHRSIHAGSVVEGMQVLHMHCFDDCSIPGCCRYNIAVAVAEFAEFVEFAEFADVVDVAGAGAAVAAFVVDFVVAVVVID